MEMKTPAAAATACGVAGGGLKLRFKNSAPRKMPGQTRKPSTRRAASAIPARQPHDRGEAADGVQREAELGRREVGQRQPDVHRDPRSAPHLSRRAGIADELVTTVSVAESLFGADEVVVNEVIVGHPGRDAPSTEVAGDERERQGDEWLGRKDAEEPSVAEEARASRGHERRE